MMCVKSVKYLWRKRRKEKKSGKESANHKFIYALLA